MQSARTKFNFNPPKYSITLNSFSEVKLDKTRLSLALPKSKLLKNTALKKVLKNVV
jgi:hypothetical protein